MPPSIFSARPLDSQQKQSPPSKSRFKAISTFLANPFHSTATISPPAIPKHVIPSEPFPYRGPVPAGSPFSLVALDGLPTISGGGDQAVSGLPGSHRHLAGLIGDDDQSRWRDMPTLASAIHLGEGEPAPPASSTFGPTKPLPPGPIPENGQMSRFTSSTSGFEIHRSKTIRRTSSRSSANDTNTELKTSTLPRRMSRRLSFDSIRLFPSSSRRKEKANEDPVVPPSPERKVEGAPKAAPNPLAMPNTRTWRSKFAVGSAKGGLVAIAKADRQARQGKADVERSSEAFQSESVGSTAGKRLSQIDGVGENKERRWNRRPLPGLPGGIGQNMPTSQPLPSSIQQHPSAEQPSVLPAFLPTILPPRTTQTPGKPFSSLGIPRSAITPFLSPAVDDMSIVDPAQSPFPVSLSTATVTSVMSVEAAADVDVKEKDNHSVIVRQQSLSELKEAFTRMRDLSGVDVSSVEGSRRTSGTGPEDELPNCLADAAPEPDVFGAMSLPGTTSSVDDATIRKARRCRPSLDLAILDAGLKAVLDLNATLPLSTAGDLSHSSSKSSDMMTCQTSFPADSEFPQTQSGRSWHTAPGESMRSLPRSKSKSTNNLASLATSKDLVDQLEIRQGPGWWSTEKPKLSRRKSEFDFDKQSGNSDRDDELDFRLAELERLAKSSTLPQRSKFTEPVSPKSQASTPSREPRIRPKTSTDFRPRSVLANNSDRQGHQRQHQSLSEWRPASSMQLRQKVALHGPRPSLIDMRIRTQEDLGSPRRSSLRKSAVTAGEDDDTPTRSLRQGTFITSRISPDIARRASFLSRAADSTTSSSPSVSRRSTGATSLVPSEDEAPTVRELVEKMEGLKKNHQIELDAILAALSDSKAESKSLKEEIANLHRLLSEGVGERDKLRQNVSELEARLQLQAANSPIYPVIRAKHRKTPSSASNILPQLPSQAKSLLLESPFIADEFGRKVRDRSLSANSHACESGIEDGEGEEGWELKLREADLKHLDDL